MGDGENVHPYRREHLEPEIAAMSVEMDDGENPPALIVNIDDPNAKGAIGKVIVWIGASIGGAVELIRRSIQTHPARVLAGTVVLTTATTSAVSPLVIGELDRPPPIAIERIVTLPAAPGPVRTVTAASTHTTSRTPTVSAPRRSPSHPPPTLMPSWQPTGNATPRRTPRFTRSPRTASPPTDTETQSTEAGRPTTPPLETPQPEPETPPTDRPPAEPSNPAAAGCGGVIEVDVDPLLDICILG